MNEVYSLAYVLITPARNEEAYLEMTIHSVISQTLLPIKWVIVSDGSTDRTDKIAKKYVSKFSWIDFLRMPEHDDRQFAAKVYCFNAGYQLLRDKKYDIIGNLDADLSFDNDYMEYLINKFAGDPKLGVAGTPFAEDSTPLYDYKYTNIEHVSGACQLFRRECFESIGGYKPIKGGGIDWVAVTTARMKGWKTRTFLGKSIFHHRAMGAGRTNVFSARYSLGQQDYYLGNHPLWEFLRMFYQMKYRPYVLGALMLYAGYIVAAIRRLNKPIPRELIRFYRREQIQRLLAKFVSIIKRAFGNLAGRSAID